MKPREFEIRISWPEGDAQYDTTLKGESDLYQFIPSIIRSITDAISAKGYDGNWALFDTVVKCEECGEWMQDGLVNTKEDTAICEACNRPGKPLKLHSTRLIINGKEHNFQYMTIKIKGETK